MKTTIHILGLAALIFLAGCEKETEGISFETNYATFEMTGDNPFIFAMGTAYAEPGIKAIAGEEELEVNAISDVDTSKPGVYTVNYSAINPDGFEASTSRMVIVYDPNAPATDLSGTYVSGVVRTEPDGSTPRAYNNLSVTLTRTAPGIFQVTDLLGGYYALGLNYGSAYAMTGYIAFNNDDTFTLLDSHVSGWGDGLESFSSGSYNPATESLTWKSVYADSDIFTVTLK